MSNTLYIYPIRHACAWEGSRHKTHIIDDSGICLCGRELFGSICDEVTKEWLEQPDYYNEVCKQCKRKALKWLEQKK